MASDQPTREPNRIMARLLVKVGVRSAVATALLALLVCLLYGYLAPIASPPTPAPSEPQPAASQPAAPAAAAKGAAAEPPPAPVGNAESRTAFTADESTRSVAKADQGWLVQGADEARRILEEARRLGGKFESTIAALKADDQGRRIAARADLTGRYRALAAAERPPLGRIDAVLKDLEAIAAPVRRALSEPDNIARPDEHQRRKVAELRTHAGKFRDEYRTLDGELEALLADLTTVREPADAPLAEAVARVEAEEARESSRLAAEAREAARKDAAKARAEAEAQAIRIAAEAEAAEIVARAEAEKARKDAALAEAKAAAEKERLRKEARGAAVREILGVFLAKGYKQPKEFQGAFLAFEATPEPHPVSFMKLRTIGALDEGIDGLRKLAWVASDRQNDRPRWAFSHVPDNWTPEARELVRRSQFLLRELGPTLVEEGLLSP